MDANYAIKSMHHITLVTRDAERTVAFYTRTLGLHFVKKTVNFDRPTTYHLYFGDATGTPGTLVTFFVWPDAPEGTVGIGTTQHFALSVETEEAQLKWKRMLVDAGLPVMGPYDHHAYHSIFFADPSGILVEIATRGPGWDALPHNGETYVAPKEMEAPFRDEAAIAMRTWPHAVPSITPDMRLGHLHHISPISSDLERTNLFYRDVLGIPLLLKAEDDDDPEAARWHWGLDGGPNGTITYYSLDAARYGGRPPQGIVGAGLTHHFAFEVPSDDALRAWREHLVQHTVDVTTVYDRNYFHSIYFHDPDGQILELATTEPGFLVDQPADRLGKDLALPPFLESRRAEIETALPPLTQGDDALPG